MFRQDYISGLLQDCRCRKQSSVLLTLGLIAGLLVSFPSLSYGQQDRPWEEHPAGTVRFATFNVAMNRDNEGQLLQELESGDSQQARQIAEILQRVRPDVLLLCEIDRDADAKAVDVFCEQYLQVSQNGQTALKFAHRFFAPSNTGVDSQVDLDGNGTLGDPNDDFGFGQFPGKYAMAVLSRYPFEEKNIRTYQKLLWSKMPDAGWPIEPETGKPFYPDSSRDHFRISSKSHWAIPVLTPVGTIHFVTAHPTPPVFDGPEDRNGKRNSDEIRLLRDIVDPKSGHYLVSDQGIQGALPSDSRFVIAGDLNADPQDGDSTPPSIHQLLKYDRIQTQPVPASLGAVAASKSQAGINQKHQGPAAEDTSDFNDQNVGNLRLDYVLPSRDLKVESCGVFWPDPSQPESELVEASDHRLVWIDVK